MNSSKEMIPMPIQFTTAELATFYGTEHYYRTSLIFPDIVHTDGVQHIASNGGGWMIDVITSYQIYDTVRNHELQLWSFHVNEDRSCLALCTNGLNQQEIIRQLIPVTDLTFDVNFILQLGSLDTVTPTWVLMLTGEY